MRLNRSLPNSRRANTCTLCGLRICRPTTCSMRPTSLPPTSPSGMSLPWRTSQKVQHVSPRDEHPSEAHGQLSAIQTAGLAPTHLLWSRASFIRSSCTVKVTEPLSSDDRERNLSKRKVPLLASEMNETTQAIPKKTAYGGSSFCAHSLCRARTTPLKLMASPVTLRCDYK